MKTSEQINELATALCVAQGKFISPPRNREVKVKTKAGDTYAFKYATLDAIMDMIREPLATNGLSIGHALEDDAKGPVCETRLTHSSGQWIATWVPVIVADGANAQGWGSAITYAKRYGVTSLLAIAADEDDDANQACGNQAQGRDRKPPAKPPQQATPQKPAPAKPATETLTPDLSKAIDAANNARDLATCAKYWKAVDAKPWATPQKAVAQTALGNRMIGLCNEVADVNALNCANEQLTMNLDPMHPYFQRCIDVLAEKLVQLDSQAMQGA